MEKAEVTLGFRGEFDDVNAQPVVNQVTKIIKNLNGNLNSDGLKTEVMPDALYIHFSLIGSNKVDVAYKLEQMVRSKDRKNISPDEIVIFFSRLCNKDYRDSQRILPGPG